MSGFQNNQVYKNWAGNGLRMGIYTGGIGNPEKIPKNVKKKDTTRISPKSKK